MGHAAILLDIADEIGRILSRFTKSRSGWDMADNDEALFKGYVVEAKVVLDKAFGRLNDFSSTLASTVNDGVANFTGTPSYASVEQSEALLRAAARNIRRSEPQENPEAQVPASNRYVALKDNQRGQVADDLADLKRAIQSSNETPEEERLIALSEIASFEATIIQPRVSSELVQRFVDRVLLWVKRLIPAALVAELAQRLIDTLLTLIA